jgi:hypothetical protein
VIRTPRVGDVVSIELPGIPKRYAIVALEAETETDFSIRTLMESTSRQRSLRLEKVKFRTPTSELSRSALRASAPRFIWRGELGFWNPEREHVAQHGIR